MVEEKKTGPDSLAAKLGPPGDGGGTRRPLDTRIVTDDLRRAIRKRTRQGSTSAPDSASVPESPEISYRRDLPRQHTRTEIYRPAPTRVVALEQAVVGSEESTADIGSVYVVTTCVNEIEGAAAVSDRFRKLICANDSPLCQRLTALCDPAQICHQDVVFMDVESTGFGNSALFLIGAMVWQGDSFEVRQFFARNYAEERAVIVMFLKMLAEYKLLVTFNGKSFDLPYIRARSAATGVRFAADPYHLDLLHVCRRIWKEQLPNCKLQTLESHICNRIRHGDIPGSEIPDAYHEYVRTNNAWQMVDVLKHNMLDLVTLADLMTHFPQLDNEEQKGA